MVSNETLADGFLAALNAHDANKLGTYLTDDVNYWEANLPEAIHGREAVEEHFRQSWESFPDASLKSINRVQSGDWFADELEWTGTNTGPITLGPEQTVPATGKSAKAWFVAVGKTSGDKVSEMRAYYDNVGFLAQLGLMDQPGSE
jgi:predicted ester cyclase